MKKILSFILVLVLALSLCACSEEKVTEEKITGTYKNIGIFSDEEYTLNEDLTFKATDSTKGTYVLNTDGAIWFSRGDEQGFVFEKMGDYYYRTGGVDCFSRDITEDAFEVSFDEKGHSNQSFSVSTIGEYYTIDFKEDGTYYATYELYKVEDYSLITKKEFEGKYTLKDNILWLEHGENKYPMIHDDGALYFNVIQKTK